MGLDFSHGEAHWSFPGFMRFRRALARHEGIDLDRMEGFAPVEVVRGMGGTWSRPWDLEGTPLVPLLSHSDCDGQLTPEECAQVAPRLREVAAAIWPTEQDSYDRVHALLLADAMEECAREGVPLEFV